MSNVNLDDLDPEFIGDGSDLFDEDLPMNNTPQTEKKEEVKSVTPIGMHDLLDAIEFLVEESRRSHLSDAFQCRARGVMEYLSQRLGISPMAGVLLSAFVDRSDDSSIRNNEIAGFFDISTIQMMRLSKEIDELETKRYIRCSRSRDHISYRVPQEVLNSLKADQPYVYESVEVDDLSTLLDAMKEAFNERLDYEITYRTLTLNVLDLFDMVPSLPLSRAMKKYRDNCQEDMLIFLYMVLVYERDNDNDISYYDLKKIFDNEILPARTKARLRNKRSPLFADGLIENVNDNGFSDPDRFCLTQQAKDELLSEVICKNAESSRSLVSHKTLTAKKMIYNAEEHSQIDELAQLLSAERMDEIQKRLKSHQMRSGFCCLFYGAPGTGKTETVYQLARLTGRDIMPIDVEKIKNCYVGESEKNIKAAFERYRTVAQKSALTPILLFNEADAVLGVRMANAEKAVDKMENSIQNIILQEMEHLDGILIATTNLTCNLDKAFERRFLYKVEFHKPTTEARAQIWTSMLPALKPEEARRLSQQYDFTGGEIENVVRRHQVETILHGDPTNLLEALQRLCQRERLSSKNPKMGF